MVKVFVIDYQPIFRRGIVSILEEHPEFQVVGNAAKTVEALARIEELHPDIVVMDAFMSGGEGVEAITLLQQKCPQVKVLILTHSENRDDLFKAIKAGARGYLLKSLDVAELIDSIRLAASGSAIVYTSMVTGLLDKSEAPNKESKGGFSNLSLREKEILWLIAQGASTKEIAAHCFVSQTTVKAHLRRISEKLDVKSRAQAVATAIKKGFLNQL